MHQGLQRPIEMTQIHGCFLLKGSGAAEVTVHVLPTGSIDVPKPTDPRQLRYRASSGLGERVAAAHQATATYLCGL